jgi:DNA-binding transcriptional MerR regulator
MRIGEFADRCGLTVRTIRFYHQLGILPRPELRGRTGWYGQQHLDRLAFVRRLQARGYSLAAIGDMVDNQIPTILQDGSSADPATAAWDDDGDPTRVSLAQLEAMVPVLAAEPALVDAMVTADLLVPADTGGFEVPQPALLRAGISLVARGVPVPVALDELSRLRSELGFIADRFAGIVQRDMLPSEPADGASAAEAAVDLLEHVWPAVLVAVGRVLTDAMQRAVLDRLVEAAQPDAAAPSAAADGDPGRR